MAVAAAITRCWDVNDEHLKEAIRSRTAMGELLEKMASVARPEEGAAKILIVLARMARPSCDWIEGSLRIEIDGSEAITVVSVTEDLGGGIRERVFPRYTLDVPISELERGLRLAPRAIEPLVVQQATTKKIVLTKGKPSRTVKPPSFKVAEDCLQKSLPPEVRKKTIAPPQKPPEQLPAVAAASADKGGKPPPRARAPSREMIAFSIPRAPKTLDLSNLAPSSEKRGPPPVPRRPKPKDD